VLRFEASRLDGVVPFGMEVIANDGKSIDLGFRYLDALLVEARIEGARDL